MTLSDAIEIALAAYDEDEAEREAILEKLAPVLFGDRELLRRAIARAWYVGNNDHEIRDAIGEYQIERAELDKEIAANECTDLECHGECGQHDDPSREE